MKSPPEQYHDDIARDRVEEFIETYKRRAPKTAESPALAEAAGD
jgi:hypothetical protein